MASFLPTRTVIGVALVATSLFGSVPLHSQTSSKTVVAGVPSELVATKQKIELRTTPLKGTARIDSAGTSADQTFRLIYTASDTTQKTTEELEYTLDGAQPAQKVLVNIEPRPLELTPQAYGKSFESIFLLLVLAVVLESALAVLFNWRPFVETFNARAVRPLVSFVVAYVFVETFSLDIVTSLVNASTTLKHDSSVQGMVLTALVLAGGSAGVNNLLVALGFRQQRTPETTVPKPPPNKAWIAVRVTRQKAVGPIQVFAGPPPAAPGLPPLIGVIRGGSRPGIRYFLSDPGRFPGYGGHQVAANADVSIDLLGEDARGTQIRKTWGPYTVAGGAVIDLDFQM